MSITIGTRLGSHEITGLLGKGGMGEVYRARDAKLKREVAIKFLPEEFLSDSDRTNRFQREAELLASLNHPNIGAIYDLEEADGSLFLVLELVEGETLAERIARGSIPLDEAFDIAKQICDALEAAHERGIIHRDLKPANIKLTPDGKVKVLDFGLAKAFEEQPQRSVSSSPTLMSGSLAGVILGTAAYMSPEQARGVTVDKRADIWAFGVVVYEMVTGRQLFEGETVSDTLASVLKTEPDWSRVPVQVQPLLRRCLAKDPKKRLRDIADAMTLVQVETAVDAPFSRKVSPALWAVSALLFIALAALAFEYFRQPTELKPVFKVTVLPPDRLGGVVMPALSSDGRRIAFTNTSSSNESMLWVRDVDSLNPRVVPGTEGATLPFWSPDNRFIGFFADGKLKKIDAAGGPAITICIAGDSPRGGTWNKNDIILFVPTASNTGIFRIPATSSAGTATPVTSLDRTSENSHRFPWFLPDGRHFLYTARNFQDPARSIVYVGDLDSSDRRAVLTAASNAVYSQPGYVLFVREGTLWSESFDAVSLKISGEAVPVAEKIDYVALDVRGMFSASQNGMLTYSSGAISGGADITARRLSWFDRSGTMTDSFGAPGYAQRPAISPDGKSVAFDRNNPQTGLFDVWLWELGRATPSPLTINSGSNMLPVWSPDGKRIAFRSDRDGGYNIYQKAVDGSAADIILDKDSRSTKLPLDWSYDGRYIIEGTTGDPKTKGDIWVLPLFGDRKPFPYLQTEADETNARLSPDGHWLA